MTTMCPDAPAFMPQFESPLSGDMAAAADCAASLEQHGLHLAFHSDAGDGLRISLERTGGGTVRRIGSRELLMLIALSPEELHAWAQRPQLPIDDRAQQAAMTR